MKFSIERKGDIAKLLSTKMRMAYAILGNDMCYNKNDIFTTIAKYSKRVQCMFLIIYSIAVLVHVMRYGFASYTTIETIAQLLMPLSNLCVLMYDVLRQTYSIKIDRELEEVKDDFKRFHIYVDPLYMNCYVVIYQLVGLIKIVIHLMNYFCFTLMAPVSVPLFIELWFLIQLPTTIMMFSHVCSLLACCNYYKAINKICLVLGKPMLPAFVKPDVINFVGRNHLKVSHTMRKLVVNQGYLLKYFFMLSLARVLFLVYMIVKWSKSASHITAEGYISILDILFNGMVTVYFISNAYEMTNHEVKKQNDQMLKSLEQ